MADPGAAPRRRSSNSSTSTRTTARQLMAEIDAVGRALKAITELRQAQRRGARQRGGAAARPCHRALPDRRGLAEAGLGQGAAQGLRSRAHSASSWGAASAFKSSRFKARLARNLLELTDDFPDRRRAADRQSHRRGSEERRRRRDCDRRAPPPGARSSSASRKPILARGACRRSSTRRQALSEAAQDAQDPRRLRHDLQPISHNEANCA